MLGVELVLKIITEPTKEYTFCGENIKLPSPCRIDWGDGTITLVTNLKQAKHKFKRKESQIIQIHNLKTPYLSLKEDKLISEIYGCLPELIQGSLDSFFYNCVNLKLVDPELFLMNAHQENISFMCYNNTKLRDIEFITRIINARDIRYFLSGAIAVRNIDVLMDWGYNVEIANGAFSRLPYLSTPHEDVLHRMTALVSAKSIFQGDTLIHECKNYFNNNHKLKHIDKAFYDCSINNIDKNWVYYLPTSVVTQPKDIFNTNLDINGI